MTKPSFMGYDRGRKTQGKGVRHGASAVQRCPAGRPGAPRPGRGLCGAFCPLPGACPGEGQALRGCRGPGKGGPVAGGAFGAVCGRHFLPAGGRGFFSHLCRRVRLQPHGQRCTQARQRREPHSQRVRPLGGGPPCPFPGKPRVPFGTEGGFSRPLPQDERGPFPGGAPGVKAVPGRLLPGGGCPAGGVSLRAYDNALYRAREKLRRP